MASRSKSKRLGKVRKKLPFRDPIDKSIARVSHRFDPARLVLERNGFLSDEQLASLVEKATNVPLPLWLSDYIAGRLRQTIKQRRGRHRHSIAGTDFLLADIFDSFTDKRMEFADIPRSQRPRDKNKRRKSPSLLAAEYLVRSDKDLRKRNISGRRLLNLLSLYGWLRRYETKQDRS